MVCSVMGLDRDGAEQLAEYSTLQREYAMPKKRQFKVLKLEILKPAG